MSDVSRASLRSLLMPLLMIFQYRLLGSGWPPSNKQQTQSPCLGSCAVHEPWSDDAALAQYLSSIDRSSGPQEGGSTSYSAGQSRYGLEHTQDDGSSLSGGPQIYGYHDNQRGPSNPQSSTSSGYNSSAESNAVPSGPPVIYTLVWYCCHDCPNKGPYISELYSACVNGCGMPRCNDCPSCWIATMDPSSRG